MIKILLIDDEQSILDLLDLLLRRKGYNVVVAENGREGLKVFCRERPDVVVLDLKMPGMDGLTVLKELRTLDPEKPVIILTGAGTPEAEQEARALGVTEFVEKEFSLHRLGGSLKRLHIDPAPEGVGSHGSGSRAADRTHPTPVASSRNNCGRS